MRTIRGIARAWPVALLLLPLLGLSGCFNPFSPRIAPTTGIYIPPPLPNSPQNVIRLFEWCWNNRDISVYKEIYTDDFLFVFALGDSAGNQFRDRPVNREEEMTIARNLFVGGGSVAPASSVVLVLDPTLRAQDDSRVGKDPKWHREILTSVDLFIKTEDSQEFRITGNARFFVVRGDSARIPVELKTQPDSTRWYIEQWWDETLSGTGGAALAPAAPGALRAGRPVVQVTVTGVAAVPRNTLLPPFDLTWGMLNAIYALPAR